MTVVNWKKWISSLTRGMHNIRQSGKTARKRKFPSTLPYILLLADVYDQIKNHFSSAGRANSAWIRLKTRAKQIYYTLDLEKPRAKKWDFSSVCISGAKEKCLEWDNSARNPDTLLSIWSMHRSNYKSIP